MSNAVENMSSKWIEFVTPEILSEIQGMFGSDMTMETLKSFSYDYIPNEIRVLIDEEQKKQEKLAVENKPKPISEPCSFCQKMKIVQEHPTLKWVSYCPDSGDVYHINKLPKLGIDAEWEEVSKIEDAHSKFFYIGNRPTDASYSKARNEAIMYYRHQKNNGYMVAINFTLEKDSQKLFGYEVRTVPKQFITLAEIDDVDTKKGKIVSEIVCHCYFSSITNTEFVNSLKVHKMISIEKLGNIHYCMNSHSQYFEDETARRKYYEGHESYLVTSQRLDEKLDEWLKNYFIDRRVNQNRGYVEAQDIRKLIVDWWGIDGNEYRWIVARITKLAKAGFFLINKRDTDAEKFDKIQQYKYKVENPIFLTADEMNILKQANRGWKLDKIVDGNIHYTGCTDEERKQIWLDISKKYGVRIRKFDHIDGEVLKSEPLPTDEKTEVQKI